MKKLFKRWLLMIQFFTRIPLPLTIECETEDFGKGLLFAPLVGVLIGGILFLFYHLLLLFLPFSVAVIFTVIFYIAVTGGIHLDGLADTFDGLFSGRSRERILEIMKDSHIGTFGVLSLMAVLAADMVLLLSIEEKTVSMVFLLMPVAGRIGSLISAGISSYARVEGLGKSFIDYCGKKELIIGIVISFILFYIFLGLPGVMVSLLVHLGALLLTFMLTIKLKGATGDILGAVCELNQTAFLLIALLVL